MKEEKIKVEVVTEKEQVLAVEQKYNVVHNSILEVREEHKEVKCIEEKVVYVTSEKEVPKPCEYILEKIIPEIRIEKDIV